MPDLKPLYVGIDFGTSGVRVSIIDDDGVETANARELYADFGVNHRNPEIWWLAFEAAFTTALKLVDRGHIVALAIDGTSGTVLPVDKNGHPLADASMYNDACNDAEINNLIAALAPAESAARGAFSALARVLYFSKIEMIAKVLHQADWISFRLSRHMVSDENNALKLGYDPLLQCWPDWIAQTGLNIEILPHIVPAGAAIGQISNSAAEQFGLPSHVQIMAGTTDGCAAFLATGASNIGDGVTSLGTTLTLKILSDKPIFKASHGIYSHHILNMWLAGGASNSGGNVIDAHFTSDEIPVLSAQLDAELPTGLNYYPLARPGERFPIADVLLQPKMTPIPENRAMFFQAILEGITAIEALGYEQLALFGAPRLKSLRTVGSGAANTQWTRLREAFIPAPFKGTCSTQASYGSAVLAKIGWHNV